MSEGIKGGILLGAIAVVALIVGNEGIAVLFGILAFLSIVIGSEE